MGKDMNVIVLPHRCQKCHRWLRSARSAGKPYGPRCEARVKAAALALLEAGLPVADRAADALLDGALVPLRHRAVFRSVSSDGRCTYLTHPNGCTCQAGLYDKTCYHVMAACVLTGRSGRV
jgi:hypothetical protein